VGKERRKSGTGRQMTCKRKVQSVCLTADKVKAMPRPFQLRKQVSGMERKQGNWSEFSYSGAPAVKWR